MDPALSQSKDPIQALKATFAGTRGVGGSGSSTAGVTPIHQPEGCTELRETHGRNWIGSHGTWHSPSSRVFGPRTPNSNPFPQKDPPPPPPQTKKTRKIRQDKHVFWGNILGSPSSSLVHFGPLWSSLVLFLFPLVNGLSNKPLLGVSWRNR